jgi:hypothetical protein
MDKEEGCEIEEDVDGRQRSKEEEGGGRSGVHVCLGAVNQGCHSAARPSLSPCPVIMDAIVAVTKLWSGQPRSKAQANLTIRAPKSLFPASRKGHERGPQPSILHSQKKEYTCVKTCKVLTTSFLDVFC